MGGLTEPERRAVLADLASDLGDIREAILRGDHDGTIESLTVVRRLKRALSASEELAALAAIDRVPMAKIAAEIDRSETSVPIMLARTQRLAPYAEHSNYGVARVSKRGLGAAEHDLSRQEKADP